MRICGTDPLSTQTPALVAIGNADETNWFALNLLPSHLSLLTAGTNLLAAEVHNQSLTSSDLGFNFELTATALLAGLPALGVTLAGNALELSAPADAAYFRLHSASNLTPPIAWAPATNAVLLSNGQWRVTLPAATNGQGFFRLSAP